MPLEFVNALVGVEREKEQHYSEIMSRTLRLTPYGAGTPKDMQTLSHSQIKEVWDRQEELGPRTMTLLCSNSRRNNPA